jgi:hypothetical protein
MNDWYYRDLQCCEVGPLTSAEFAVCVSMGEILPETRVWRPGLAEWTTYAALLAEMDAPTAESSSPASHRSPPSSTYQTLIALGISRVHQGPFSSGLRTSPCTLRGVTEPDFDFGRDEVRERPAARRAPRGWGAGDSIWLGRQFVRMALTGAVFVLVHTFLEHRAAHSLQVPAAGLAIAAEMGR